MKFFIDNWILIALAIASGALLLLPTLRKGAAGANSVGTGEAVRLINREKGVLVDVREPDEFAAGHAGGARNVPLDKVEAAAQGTGGTGGANKLLPSNKTLPLLVLCATGARANRAVATLRNAGYDKAVSVAGGTVAWREAGLPIEKSAEKIADKAVIKA